MPIGRGERSDTRQRREFQREHAGLGTAYGNGLVWDPASDSLAIDLTPDAGGILTFSAGDLTTQYMTTSGAVGNVTVNVVADLNLNLSAATGEAKISGVDVAIQAGINGLLSQSVGSTNFTSAASILFDSLSSGGSSIDFTAGSSMSFTTAATNSMTFTSGQDFNATGGSLLFNFTNAVEFDISGNPAFRTDGTDSIFVCTGDFTVTSARLGFFATAAVVQGGPYAVGTVPAASLTLNLATATSAYAGVPVALLNAATVVDLNALRVDVVNIAAVLRQLIANLGNEGQGPGLIASTGY